MLTLRRLYLLMGSVSSLMDLMDGVLGREGVLNKRQMGGGGGGGIMVWGMIFANGNIW